MKITSHGHAVTWPSSPFQFSPAQPLPPLDLSGFHNVIPLAQDPGLPQDPDSTSDVSGIGWPLPNLVGLNPILQHQFCPIVLYMIPTRHACLLSFIWHFLDL